MDGSDHISISFGDYEDHYLENRYQFGFTWQIELIHPNKQPYTHPSHILLPFTLSITFFYNLNFVFSGSLLLQHNHKWPLHHGIVPLTTTTPQNASVYNLESPFYRKGSFKETILDFTYIIHAIRAMLTMVSELVSHTMTSPFLWSEKTFTLFFLKQSILYISVFVL